MHKAKLNFCHAYKVNCFEEQAENKFVARLNIRGVPFWWLEIDRVRDHRDIKPNEFLIVTNKKALFHTHTTLKTLK